MGLTISLTQLNRKKQKDGRIPIYIRITEDRKSRYRSTGVSVKKNEWNANKQKVKKLPRDEHVRLNVTLERRLNEVKGIKHQLYKRDVLSMDGILNELTGDTDTRSILGQAKNYRNELNNDSRYWEHRHFGVVINNLTGFINKNGHKDRLDKLDSAWIEDFQTYLLKDVGNGNNTIRKKLQRLKGLTDWLQKSKAIQKDPFLNVDKVDLDKTNSKVKLTKKQIEAIEALELEPYSDLWHVRNYFIYSFYNAGIRFGDVCCLKWDNLIDGRLIYKMNKTGGQKNIRQKEPMYRILFEYVDTANSFQFEQWKPTERFYLQPFNTDAFYTILKPVVRRYANEHKGQYIFPILKKGLSDPNQLRKQISSKNVIVNRHLKTIAEWAGIQANVSFHVSRHSFAQYALKKGIDLYAISKALGHSDLKITEQYLKSFDEEKLDESMNKLF